MRMLVAVASVVSPQMNVGSSVDRPSGSTIEL